MKQSENHKANNKQTIEHTIIQPKEPLKRYPIAKYNFNRIKDFIKEDEWIIFKKHCIDIDTPVYKQIGKIIKNYLKEKELI